jgi:hypothetical protein
MVGDETFKLRLEGNSVTSASLAKVAPIYVRMDFLRSTGGGNSISSRLSAAACIVSSRCATLPNEEHPALNGNLKEASSRS